MTTFSLSLSILIKLQHVNIWAEKINYVMLKLQNCPYNKNKNVKNKNNLKENMN